MEALVTPEVLKWARGKRLRLSLRQAADKLKIEADQLEAWEAGTARPSVATLKKIAGLYKTHVSIFYLPVPPKDFQPLADYRVLPESIELDEEQSYRLSANIGEAIDRRETILELYELLEELPPTITLNISDTEELDQVVGKIHRFLDSDLSGLRQAGDEYSALSYWKRTVEDKGILVCHTSANSHLSVELETMRGFCIAERPFPIIVLNSKDHPYGRIFTILHELVHIALGKSVIHNSDYSSLNDPALNHTEIFCNQVAAEVLVPRRELIEIFRTQTVENDLPEMAKHFNVSREVIMRRLLTLERISQQDYKEYRARQQDEYKRFQQDRHKTKPQKGYRVDYSKRLLNVSGELLARAAFTAYHEEKITLFELSTIFSNCDPKHLSKIRDMIFP